MVFHSSLIHDPSIHTILLEYPAKHNLCGRSRYCTPMSFSFPSREIDPSPPASVIQCVSVSVSVTASKEWHHATQFASAVLGATRLRLPTPLSPFFGGALQVSRDLEGKQTALSSAGVPRRHVASARDGASRPAPRRPRLVSRRRACAPGEISTLASWLAGVVFLVCIARMQRGGWDSTVAR